MSKVNKAIIPAAGEGKRMEPISSYLSKSMLPLGKKPVLHHIVEELREASISEIAIVARSNNTALFSYFMDFPEVELIIDDSTSGPGGAMLKAREFIGGENFVTIFADAPTKGDGRVSYLKELINLRANENAEAALAIYEVPQKEISSRGVVTFKVGHQKEGAKIISDIIEKPDPDNIGSRWASACRYVLSHHIFEALGNITPDKDEELQLTTAIKYMIKEGRRVIGYPLPKTMHRYDTGNFEGYFEAFRDFADSAID